MSPKLYTREQVDTFEDELECPVQRELFALIKGSLGYLPCGHVTEANVEEALRTLGLPELIKKFHERFMGQCQEMA